MSDHEKERDETMACHGCKVAQTVYDLRKQIGGMVNRVKYQEQVKAVESLHNQYKKMIDNRVSKSVYEPKLEIIKRRDATIKGIRTRAGGYVTRYKYGLVAKKLAALQRQFDAKVDLESINRTEPLRRERDDLKIERGAWMIERSALKIAVCAARRAMKNAEGDATRQLIRAEEFADALSEIASFHLAGEHDKAYDCIPREFQLQARNIAEPPERIGGSSEDAGLDIKEKVESVQLSGISGQLREEIEI